MDDYTMQIIMGHVKNLSCSSKDIGQNIDPEDPIERVQDVAKIVVILLLAHQHCILSQQQL